MNHHMHLFNFYHESHEPKYIENNLTRAFALCLKHDPVLLFAFLKQVLSTEDFNYLFYVHDSKAAIDFNMQVETEQIVDDTRTLYAIGLTDGEDQDWSNIAEGIQKADKLNITDMVITLKDIKIIIEIKKYDHDCKEQLRQQMSPFIGRGININTRHLTWTTVLNMIEQVGIFYKYSGRGNEFIDSFLQLIKSRFNNWIPTKPFGFLSYAKDNSDSARHDMWRRLMQSMHAIGDDKVDALWDRTAIKINRPWATEAIPEFWHDKEGNEYLVMHVWPGNTKQQGYSLYSMPMDWTNNTQLNIDGKQYEVYIERHIKFMHFNRYVTSIEIPMDETSEQLKAEINTPNNQYYDLAGKWNREQWDELNELLDKHFKFDWKERCKWDEHFENTDRGYLTLSLGYTVTLYVPYKVIQEMDKANDGYKKVGTFLEGCKDAIVAMIEGS